MMNAEKSLESIMLVGWKFKSNPFLFIVQTLSGSGGERIHSSDFFAIGR